VTPDWPHSGAFAFGLIIGWYVYFINRYRKGDVQLGDLTTIIGTLGGGAIVSLYGKDPALFGCYGVGLATGFFLYFIVLLILVRRSRNFDSDWFLDGRRKNPASDSGYGQDARPPMVSMDLQPQSPLSQSQHPAAAQQFFIGATPVVPGAAPQAVLRPQLASQADTVIQYCKEEWPAHETACNFFAIAVATRLGVTLRGRADDIVDLIRGAGWTALADGVAARDAAMSGKFVIGGIKSTEFTTPRNEGHVAVVVSGPMNAGQWAPAGYWGSTDPDVAKSGGSGNPISLCFRKEDQAKITYAQADS